MTSQDHARRRALGERVRAERDLKDLSIREAARLAGIDRGTWTGVEEARTIPQSHKAAQMERVLGWAPGSIRSALTDPPPVPTGTVGPDPADTDLTDLTDLELAKEAHEVWSRKYKDDPAKALALLDEYIELLIAARKRMQSRASEQPDMH